MSRAVSPRRSASALLRHSQSVLKRLRRFTGLTNTSSKKIENHGPMVALYTT